MSPTVKTCCEAPFSAENALVAVRALGLLVGVLLRLATAGILGVHALVHTRGVLHVLARAAVTGSLRTHLRALSVDP